MASTHHNEIIDIAALAATIPHRRHLSFWAKSTMFANPVTGAILSSSGAIPVRRNPNNSSPSAGIANYPQDPSSSTSFAAGSGKRSETNATIFTDDALRASLFRETSKALSANQVVGVFPEGTSYTQASIVQMLPGAAWAAVEFERYMREVAEEKSIENGKMKGKEVDVVETGLRIVPVAVVYTDKARYLSRVFIKYGDPIFPDIYAKELFSSDEDDPSKAVVKKIMAQMEKQLREMTINAADWDTICAVSMARNILWGDEDNISLREWVVVSQRLVQIFEDPQESTQHLKSALTKYYALLHYAGIKHSVLYSLLPSSTASLLDVPPNTVPGIATLVKPTVSLLSGLPLALIQLVLFIPPFLFHLPGYLTGPLLKKCLAVPGEEESPAQFKAVGGGLGIGANMALVLGVLWRRNKLSAITTLLGVDEDDKMVKRILGLAGAVYLGVVVLVKWHKLLVKANYRQLQRLLTYHKLLSAFAFTRSSDVLSTAEVDAYTRPPLPAANVFIKKREASASDHDGTSNTSVIGVQHRPPARKIVRHLLQARGRACGALHDYLRASQNAALAGFLKSKAARDL